MRFYLCIFWNVLHKVKDTELVGIVKYDQNKVCIDEEGWDKTQTWWKGKEKETIISKIAIDHNHYMATVNMQEPWSLSYLIYEFP